LALDEPKDTDNVYDVEGFRYVIDKDFMERVKPVKIDYMTMGFKVSSSIDFGSGSGCSCSTEQKSSCGC